MLARFPFRSLHPSLHPPHPVPCHRPFSGSGSGSGYTRRLCGQTPERLRLRLPLPLPLPMRRCRCGGAGAAAMRLRGVVAVTMLRREAAAPLNPIALVATLSSRTADFIDPRN